MVKVLTLKHQMKELFGTHPVTCELTFRINSLADKKFMKMLVSGKGMVGLRSYNTDTASGCLTASPEPTHELIRQHACLSLTQSGTPIQCIVVKEDIPQLGDADMNEILTTILAFYDIDFEREMSLSRNQLSLEYDHMKHVISFGKSNSKAYYNLLVDAQEKYNKIMGATNSILQQLNQAETPKPTIDRSNEGLPPMGQTTGTNVTSGLVDKEDPWSGGKDPWISDYTNPSSWS